jgi:hypothetical protein
MFDGERGKMVRGTDFCGPAVSVAGITLVWLVEASVSPASSYPLASKGTLRFNTNIAVPEA